MPKTTIIPFIVFVLAAQGTLLFSQERTVPGDTIRLEDPHSLREVVVTGTRTEKRLADSPVLTMLIREKDIRKSASVSFLESLQDNLPGIVITPNAMGNNLRIKGLNSRNVLFLVDGERLVSEGAGGNINFDQIDVDNIQRIEIIEGASSALYGSNAVGAVINVITKEPVHNLEVGLHQTVESYNTFRSKIDVGSSFDRFNIRAGAFRTSSDGFEGGGGTGADRYEDYGGDLKVGYKPTVRSDVNVFGRIFRHETFNDPGTLNVSHSLDQNAVLGANSGFTSRDNRNSLRFSVYFDKFFDYNVLEKKNNELRLKGTASYFSARVIDTYSPTAKWELTGGVEYNNERNYSTTAFGSEPVTKLIDDLNVFAVAQYKLFKNFDVVGGARYIDNSQFGSAFTPKVSLMYGVGGFRFRGGVGSAFRAPSIKELYYDFDHSGMFWVYGNPDLLPEKGVYTSLSAEYSAVRFNASLSGYHNRIDNKIIQYDVINAQKKGEKYYKNVRNATLQGFDTSLSATFFRALVLRGTYSFCDAVDNSTGLQIESSVRHSGTGSLTWNGRIGRSPFSLQFAGRMNSPIQYQMAVTDADGNGSFETSESKPYAIWKAALVKPFTFGKHAFELTFKVDNLFDFRDANFINPGRQYLAGIRYNFKTQFNK